MVVGILLISTVPLYAQPQEQNVAKLKEDARKPSVLSALTGVRPGPIAKLSTSSGGSLGTDQEKHKKRADQEKDRKKARALSQTINQLQKKLGFEFVVLENILSDIDLKSPDGQENRFNNPKPQSVLSRITTVVAAAKSTLLAARRATVAEGRNIGPGRLCDDDFEVCRPFVESVPFLRRIGIAVIGANEFWR